MHPTRIAELLEPFLRSPTTAPPSHPQLKTIRDPELKTSGDPELKTSCHSESGQRPGEEPAVSPANNHRLTTTALERISTYIDILLRWNARINLTAIRDPEQIVTRHFGESLFAARHLFPLPPSVSPVSSVVKDVDFDLASDKRPPTSGPRVADLGSGPGFPGLPIKLWAPHISLTLIESNHKKAAFLREVTRALTLTDVDIQNARAETLTTPFDVVTLRAVERFEAILPAAASLVAPAGRLALLISAAQQAKVRSTLSQLAWSEPYPIPQSRSRTLLVASRQDSRSYPSKHQKS